MYLQKSYAYPEGALSQGLLFQTYNGFEDTWAFFARHTASFFNYKLDCLGGKTKQVLTQPAFPSLLAYTVLGTQAR